jgi:hypothetical protein
LAAKDQAAALMARQSDQGRFSLFGAFENPNQHPVRAGGEQRIGNLDPQGNPVADPTYVATWSDRVFDRVGSSVLWNVGVRFKLPRYKLEFLLDGYNILDTRSYHGEGYYDLPAVFEAVASPWLGASALMRVRLNI